MAGRFENLSGWNKQNRGNPASDNRPLEWLEQAEFDNFKILFILKITNQKHHGKESERNPN